MTKDNNADKNIENDELIRLVSSNANTSSQYVIFENIDQELFGINVGKVEELIINKNIDITKETKRNNNFVLGVSKIRGNIVTMLNFDSWLSDSDIQRNDLRFIILTNYLGVRLGLIIKSVIGIHSFDMNVFEKVDNDDKIIFIAEININGKKKLCRIFDSDRLALDVHPITNSSKSYIKSTNDKIILFAEDSTIMQGFIKKAMNDGGYNYEIYNNGKELLDKLRNINPDDVGLIVTDIEMPVLNGMKLMEILKDDDKLSSIPIIVNTNMANNAVVADSYAFGAKDIVLKVDSDGLLKSIEEHRRS